MNPATSLLDFIIKAQWDKILNDAQTINNAGGTYRPDVGVGCDADSNNQILNRAAGPVKKAI